MMPLESSKKQEISEKIAVATKVAVRGGGTKTALSHNKLTQADFVLDISEFQGSKKELNGSCGIAVGS